MNDFIIFSLSVGMETQFLFSIWNKRGNMRKKNRENVFIKLPHVLKGTYWFDFVWPLPWEGSLKICICFNLSFSRQDVETVDNLFHRRGHQFLLTKVSQHGWSSIGVFGYWITALFLHWRHNYQVSLSHQSDWKIFGLRSVH